MAPASTENTDHVRSETGSFLQRNRSGVGFRADAENNTNISSTFAAGCQLKKKSHNLKVELFSLVEMLKTPNLGGSISVALRKLLQGGGRWSQAIYKFATKGAGSLNTKDYYDVRKIRCQV